MKTESKYSYMKADHAAEADATEREIDRLRIEQPELTGDSLLNLATERAGYDPGYSGIEVCNECGSIYHRDYGGEYIDPNDYDGLAEELGVAPSTLAQLAYGHYCDFQCLRSAVYALPEQAEALC